MGIKLHSMEETDLNEKRRSIIAKIVVVLEIICSVAIMVIVHESKLIPAKYEIAMCAVLILILIAVTYFTMLGKNKILYWIFLVLSVLISIVMVLAGIGISQTKNTIEEITKVTEDTTEVSVYVYDADQAQTISDAAQYTFGILETLDSENTQKAISEMEDNLNASIETVAYPGVAELADAMIDNEVQAIILNESYLDMIAELSDLQTEQTGSTETEEPQDFHDYAEFVKSLRKISGYSVATEEEPQADDTSFEDNGTFVMYISGIDTYGSTSKRSRSDVNILAVVNTNTKKILLVSTPRDYYVPLSISNGVKDKLTHAGIYGIQCSQDTLGMLYGIDIDYYFRLNFSGFEKIIDALGGITVNSDYTFDGRGQHFVKGDNYLNGEQALIFARERYAFATGDRQRGEDQMKVIKAVFDKATSSAVLANYTEMLASLQGTFETSMSYDTLAKIVRQQLDQGTGWDIETYSVNGTGQSSYTYSISNMKVYVMVPDQSTVENAKEKIQAVLDGE